MFNKILLLTALVLGACGGAADGDVQSTSEAVTVPLSINVQPGTLCPTGAVKCRLSEDPANPTPNLVGVTYVFNRVAFTGTYSTSLKTAIIQLTAAQTTAFYTAFNASTGASPAKHLAIGTSYDTTLPAGSNINSNPVYTITP